MRVQATVTRGLAVLAGLASDKNDTEKEEVRSREDGREREIVA